MANNPGLNVDWYPAELPSGTGVHLRTCVTADGNAAKGTLYVPAGREPRDTTVVVAMHPRVDVSRHYLTPALLAAGHGVYAQQSRDAGSDLRLVHEQTLLDLGAGLEWLHGLGAGRTVGLGNSGGGGLLTYYVQQSQLAPEDRIARTPAGRPSFLDKATLPTLDALAYLAPHPGQGTLLSRCIDPSVTDEDDAFSVDPALDPFAEPTATGPRRRARRRRRRSSSATARRSSSGSRGSTRSPAGSARRSSRPARGSRAAPARPRTGAARAPRGSSRFGEPTGATGRSSARVPTSRTTGSSGSAA